MSRRFKPKHGDTLADFLRDAAVLVFVAGGLLFLHSL